MQKITELVFFKRLDSGSFVAQERTSNDVVFMDASFQEINRIKCSRIVDFNFEAPRNFGHLLDNKYLLLAKSPSDLLVYNIEEEKETIIPEFFCQKEKTSTIPISTTSTSDTNMVFGVAYNGISYTLSCYSKNSQKTVIEKITTLVPNSKPFILYFNL